MRMNQEPVVQSVSLFIYDKRVKTRGLGTQPAERCLHFLVDAIWGQKLCVRVNVVN